MEAMSPQPEDKLGDGTGLIKRFATENRHAIVVRPIACDLLNDRADGYESPVLAIMGVRDVAAGTTD